MNEILTIILATLALALMGCFLVRAFASRKWRVACNIAEGTHEGGRLTRILDNAVTARHLLAKKGLSDNTVDICGATDEPLGAITDEGVAGDSINVQHFGGIDTTIRMVASKAIAVGARLYTTAGGKVTDTAVAGAYCVGRALSVAGADNDPLEVAPSAPQLIATRQLIAAGQHDWAGGAAASDSIDLSAVGLEAGDLVFVSLAAIAGTETSVAGALDEGNDQIDLTLDANGTDGSTKVNYQVLR